MYYIYTYIYIYFYIYIYIYTLTHTVESFENKIICEKLMRFYI